MAGGYYLHVNDLTGTSEIFRHDTDYTSILLVVVSKANSEGIIIGSHEKIYSGTEVPDFGSAVAPYDPTYEYYSWISIPKLAGFSALPNDTTITYGPKEGGYVINTMLTVFAVISTGTTYEHILLNGNKVQADSAIRDGNGVRIDTNYAKKADVPAITVSTAEPTSSDGADGDIWIQYTA